MRHVLKSTLIVAFLFVFSASFVHAQLSVDVPVLRSNSKGVYSAFKAKGNVEFDVVVRLYEDAAKATPYLDTLGDPWAETLHFAVQGKQSLGDSDPLGGDYVLYLPVDGFVNLLIGATEALPEGLSGAFVYCTTQVTPYKKGVAKTPYAESPTQLIRGSQEVLNYISLVEQDDGLGGKVTTIRIEGANLQIVNGSGTTGGAVDGLGNLIVGYNEFGNLNGDDRTGSHNIVTGQENSFSSYGGLVAGQDNTISGAWSTVSGGFDNTASGSRSSVSGGRDNTASNYFSSVSGGQNNTASDFSSSVSGGYRNEANGNYSSVSGGQDNTAYGYASSVSGGGYNTASEGDSSVSGGYNNTASGYASSVSGGFGNEAYGTRSSVSGGSLNTASATDSSISGGQDNTASGYFSSVSGGNKNTASGGLSSVSGGYNNTASGGFASSISGGYENEASGPFSSVSGGYGLTAADVKSWAAGTYSSP